MKKFLYSLVILMAVLMIAVPGIAAETAQEDIVLDANDAGSFQDEKKETLTIRFKNTDTVCQNGVIREGDITYLPLREVLGLYGVQVSWAKEADTKVIMTAGKKQYEMITDLRKYEGYGLDDKVYMLRHEDNTLYLPVYFYAQLMNCKVSWDGEHNTLIVDDSKKKKEATIFNPTNGGISYTMVMNLPEYTKTVAPTVSRSEGLEARPVYSYTGTGEIYQTGIASFYSKHLDGCRTASGERYRAAEMVAAHKTLPFGTVVRVQSQWSDNHVDVRIIDRGPYISGRIIDLSYAAATEMNMLSKGIGPVTLEILYMP